MNVINKHTFLKQASTSPTPINNGTETNFIVRDVRCNHNKCTKPVRKMRHRGSLLKSLFFVWTRKGKTSFVKPFLKQKITTKTI